MTVMILALKIPLLVWGICLACQSYVPHGVVACHVTCHVACHFAWHVAWHASMEREVSGEGGGCFWGRFWLLILKSYLQQHEAVTVLRTFEKSHTFLHSEHVKSNFESSCVNSGGGQSDMWSSRPPRTVPPRLDCTLHSCGTPAHSCRKNGAIAWLYYC